MTVTYNLSGGGFLDTDDVTFDVDGEELYISEPRFEIGGDDLFITLEIEFDREKLTAIGKNPENLVVMGAALMRSMGINGVDAEVYIRTAIELIFGFKTM